KRVEVLTVVVRVVGQPAVAENNVEVPVRAKSDGASRVIPVRPCNPEKLLLGRRVRPIRVVLAHAKPGDHGRQPLRIVEGKELAVLLELRMEAEAEEPLLVLAVGVAHLL